MSDGNGETTIQTGYGTYKGRQITSVSMELLRRSEDIDAVYEIDDEFVFIGRARVDKHVHEVQSDGCHLILKVAVREAYRVDEGEAKQLLDAKRDERRKAEVAREAAEKARREAGEGAVAMDLEGDPGQAGSPADLED